MHICASSCGPISFLLACLYAWVYGYDLLREDKGEIWKFQIPFNAELIWCQWQFTSNSPDMFLQFPNLSKVSNFMFSLASPCLIAIFLECLNTSTYLFMHLDNNREQYAKAKVTTNPTMDSTHPSSSPSQRSQIAKCFIYSLFNHVVLNDRPPDPPFALLLLFNLITFEE